MVHFNALPGLFFEIKESFTNIKNKWLDKALKLHEEIPGNEIHIDQILRYLEIYKSLEEVKKLLAVTKDRIPRTIRVNTILISTSMLKKRLERKDVHTSDYKYVDYGLIVEKSPLPIGALHEYLYGYYTLQKPASMLVVPSMKLNQTKPSLIIDMCAGAGIKTTQISQHLPQSKIIAIDTNRRKLLALKNHLSRLGVFNVIAFKLDARNLQNYNLSPNAILLDAPCSGEGLLPFPEGRWPRTISDIVGRVKLQYQLLDTAVKILTYNGVLLYATCSISVEENEYVLSKIIEKYNDVLEIEEPDIKMAKNGITEYSTLKLNKKLKLCKRIHPHIHLLEGFTICLLRKTKK